MSWTCTKGQNGAIITYDAAYLNTKRWLDAVGETVVKFKLEPGQAGGVDNATFVPNALTSTVTGTSPVTVSELIGESLLLTTGGTEYNGINLQSRNVAFKCETGKPMYFGIKCIAENATLSDLLFGMCVLKTDLLKVSAAHGILAANVEGIFFFKATAATVLTFKTYKDGSETNTADYGTAHGVIAAVYEFYWDGSKLYGYIDNSLVGVFSANLPDTELTPSINIRAGSAAARTLIVHWMRAFEIR